MNKSKTNFTRIVYALTALLIALGIFIAGTVAASSTRVPARAEVTKSYSSVYDDLSKDSYFTTDLAKDDLSFSHLVPRKDRFIVNDDHNIFHFWGIAESEDGELFVYISHQFMVHTLSGVLDWRAYARCISISVGFCPDGQTNMNPRFYELELLSYFQKFEKYLVKGLQVPATEERYYNIVSIYFTGFPDGRYPEEEIPGSDLTGFAKSVGLQFSAVNSGNDVIYEATSFDTLQVFPTFIGHLSFSDGWLWSNIIGTILGGPFFTDKNYSWGDAWFYAFRCDQDKIEHIYDADLNYSLDFKEYYEVSFPSDSGTDILSTENNKVITLTDTDFASYTGKGLFSRKFSWNRILKKDDFMNAAEAQGVVFSEEMVKSMEKAQWVFSFLETPRTAGSSTSNDGWRHRSWVRYYDVSDVSLLRLHYFNGEFSSNLGVVANIYDPDNTPDGYGPPDYSVSGAFNSIWNNFGAQSCSGTGDVLSSIISILGGILLAVGGVLLIIFVIIPLIRLIARAVDRRRLRKLEQQNNSKKRRK